jgi:integrase
MSKLANQPKYCLHKPSGNAYVRIQGQVVYLGKFGTSESREKYHRYLAELAAAPAVVPTLNAEESLTVVELIEAYWKHAQGYYVKQGQPTDHLHAVRVALRRLRLLYGNSPAGEFSPKSLKTFRQEILETGVSRGYINSQVQIIRGMFRWGVSEELVPNGTYQALCTVDGLRKGRTTAREPAPVTPVADVVIEATLPHLPTAVADMVRFQRLTGGRPGEICQLRPMDLDRSGEVWEYRPGSHKTEHHGKCRIIYVGPKAQNILLPYLSRPNDSYCFDPRETVRNKLEMQRVKRKTRVQPSQKNRKKSNPMRFPGAFYRTNAYLWAIKRAVQKANKQIIKEAEEMGIDNPVLLPNWHPNQLRHTAATAIRKQFGLEAAQVILGHSKADVTQLYAETDAKRAVEAVEEIG